MSTQAETSTAYRMKSTGCKEHWLSPNVGLRTILHEYIDLIVEDVC